MTIVTDDQFTILLLKFAFVCLLFTKIGTTDSVKDWSDYLPDSYSPASPLTNVSVNWTLETKGILKLSAKDMEFCVDVKMLIFWFDNLIPVTKRINYAVLPKDIITRMFYPYYEFTNCKACNQLIVDPARYSFALVKNQVYLEYREKLSFNCVFDLSRYPFDVQICQINVQQTTWFGYVNTSLDKEKKEYSQLDKTNLLLPPEYKLKDVEVLETKCKVFSHGEETYFCFSYKFTFQRKILQHMLNTFIPSFFIVMLSWISFWLDPELAAPRVALGQTSLLTLTAQFNSVQGKLPSTSSVKALDIWMFVCIAMAFATLVEFAISYNFTKLETHVLPAKRQLSSFVKRNRVSGTIKVTSVSEKKSEWFRSRSIDFWAKIIFPISFFIFNIVFWYYYVLLK